VDGANVGMYGMNFEKAEFSFKQLDTLMSYLQTRKRAEGYQGPLVVLHEHRCSRGPGRYPASQQIQRAWTKAGVLWTTPPGSNDDWCARAEQQTDTRESCAASPLSSA
jgi:proteinaceous RNase P